MPRSGYTEQPRALALGHAFREIRPESGGGGASSGSSARFSTAAPKIGCHFQGTFHQAPNPGLKPWAVLCSRFAA